MLVMQPTSNGGFVMTRLERFIKVGDKAINLDLVTDIDVKEGRVNVWLAAPGKDEKPRLIVFKGDEAKVIGDWVKINVRDLIAEASAPLIH
jgi:hypothetical protein